MQGAFSQVAKQFKDVIASLERQALHIMQSDLGAWESHVKMY